MESQSRWLVRVGAFLVAFHPFTPFALSAADACGIPVPVPWLPFENRSITSSGGSMPFSLFRSVFLLLILAAPVLATVPSLREHRILGRFQIALVFVLIFVLALSGCSGESSVPEILRWGLPLIAGFWIGGMLLLGFDTSSVGRAARILPGALIFFWALFTGAAGPRGLAPSTGLPLCLLGAASMTAGELLWRSPKAPEGVEE